MPDLQVTSKGEQTRQEILAAAKRLFLNQGFSATTMRQIAHQVGITPAAIYNHYPSKDQLFTVLLQSAAPYNELFALFDNIAADSPEDLLRQRLHAALGLVAEHQDYLHLAFIDAQERNGVALAGFLPEVLPRAQLWYQQLVALDAAQPDAPRLRPIPFLVFLRIAVSLLTGFLLTDRVATPDRLPQMADIDWPEALADAVLHWLLKPSSQDEGRRA